MFILVAGNETTRNLISNCLYTLATVPGALPTALRARPRASIAPFVEESLRLDSPVQVLARAVLADTEIAGARCTAASASCSASRRPIATKT